MEPVERAWSSLPRLVRDLFEASGKRVRLLTEGRGTSIDRTLLAAVKDTDDAPGALTHHRPWRKNRGFLLLPFFDSSYLSNKVFLLSPPNVSVAAEDKQRIADAGGFFNQS